jgi:hypothetical protein
MNQQFDELTLSAYIDGELDQATMSEVEIFLKKDENARKYVLNAIRTAARLRSSMNAVLHEPVPERLISTIHPQAEKKVPKRVIVHPFFRIAALIILVLLGFGAGSYWERDGNGNFSVAITPLPTRYSQVVDQALENNLSGTPVEWQSHLSPVIVSVTPVKTYRDKSGLYYREYRLEVSSERESQKINALAYRTAKGKWKTKAVFYQ